MAQITIHSWERFNGRKDVKASSWFRLSHSLFEDPELFDLDHAELCFWIYILSLASKKNSETVTLNHAHAERIGRFPRAVIDRALEKLSAAGCLTVHVTGTLRARNADVTDTSATNERTNERTDGTRARTRTDEQPPKSGLTAEGINALKETWIESKRALGAANLRITTQEERLIAQAVKQHGLEDADLALYGARHEPIMGDFDPKAHIDISRVLLPDREGKPRIQKFVEYGAKGRQRVRSESEKRERRDEVLNGEGVPPPEEIRQKLAAFGLGRMPR